MNRTSESPCQCPLDGLFDPPRGIGGKLRPSFGVKAPDAFHQADVALIDEIQQRQSQAVIGACDFNHQPQVRLDHVFARLPVTAVDSFGERDLLLRSQQFHLADFAEIELQAVAPQRLP